MRRDNLEIGLPPRDDRPGDSWMPAVAADGSDRGTRVRTWTGRRRRWTAIFGGTVAAGTLLTMSFVPRAALLKPGELSTPHAQILSGDVSTDACAACHHQAEVSPWAWFGSARDAHAGVTQSDLCMDCHHRTIAPNLAYAAHNLPLSVRDQMTETIRLASKRSGADDSGLLQRFIPDAAVDQNDVACGTCHKEHHGADADLLALSNTQCQTCHSKRFGAFPDSHPDWSKWPYGRGGTIAFNHATHQQTHFPAWKSGAKKFDCATCHPDVAQKRGEPAAARGELARVASYEDSCRGCHDDAMNVLAGKGIDFLSLPTLPGDALTGVEGWPDAASGYPDGVISPLAELMLRADEAVSGAVHAIPAADVSRLEGDADQTADRLNRLALGYQALIDQVGRSGQSVMRQRLLNLGISPGPFDAVLRSLPPQLIESAGRSWFSQPNPRGIPSASLARPRSRVRLVLADDEDLLGLDLLGDSNEDELLLGDPLAEDPLAEDPLAVPVVDPSPRATPTNAADLVQRGGWYRDDQRFAVSYRGHGHADPVMVGMIETFAQLADHDPLKQRFFDMPFVVACVSCHSGATAIPAAWNASNLVGRRGEFTKFSHRAHLNVAALADCTHCHQVRNQNALPDQHVVFAGTDFQPLPRQSCAGCHHAQAAGDACTQCHRYHIGP
ncbi:Doubled CXXCH motif (Paired_CXXCH_1) [Stieleria maiorica]|uniref:Doubled CXXCH motif (Paired_CXXCH_1) n=1 Tax=Stieleria maiorica TaxID=2795974 RepID=A0A5B9MCN7_9BACT|nr:cytochrome c3 family protein [Stieleria maiorica]QEF98279.1 Doubled CXXCH motif (Paired_CXXCH_1) [Stieleria maiorica]